MPFLDYKRVIDKLLNAEAKEGHLYLSLYIDTSEYNNPDPETIINSLINEIFDQTKELKSCTALKRLLVEKILELLKAPNYLDNGLAIFTQLDLKDSTVSDLEVVHLYRPPQSRYYTGQTYDIGQLVWIDSQTFNGLLVCLHADEAKIYELQKETLIDVDKIETPFTAGGTSSNVEDRDQLDEESRTRDARRINYDRSRLDSVKRFYTIVEDRIKELIPHNPLPHFYIVICFSQVFQFMQQEIEANLKAKFPKTTVISESLNMKDQEAVLTRVLELLKNHERDRRIELLEKTKENIDLYANGWEEVLDALRNRKIDTLFINADSDQEGFMLSEEMIFIDKQPDSIKLDSLLPWVIRNTLMNGGTVEVFRNPYEGLALGVGARLRF